MGIMSPVWEGLRSSRMALLAVNALLLGTTSNCGVTAAAVAAVPSWDAGGHMISLGRSIATLPRTLTAASPRRGARIEPRGKVGRRRDDESDEADCDCKSNRSAGRRSRTPLHGEQQNAASSAATPTKTNRDRHGLLSRRLLDGSRGTPPQKEAMWRKVLVPRASAAVAASSTGSGTISQQQQRQQQQQQQPSLGGRAFSLRRLRKRGGAISSSAGPGDRSQQQNMREQQQLAQDRHNDKQGSPSVSTTTTAAAATAASPAVSLVSGSAAARAVAAATSTAAASPTPSYLRWLTNTDTRQTTGSEPNSQQDEKTRLRKKGQQLLSSGAGSRNGRTDSGRTDSVSNSGAGGSNSVEKGSLNAAKASRGGGGAGAVSLTFKEAMFAGAVSRSLAQTCMQPANVVKTLLQGRGTSSQLSNLSFKLLTRGAGAQFLMSMPHGAFNFATLEVILGVSARVFPTEWREKAGPVLDFVSSSVATLVCSVVSTPQMVLTDRIMAGMYPNLVSGVREISRTQGLKGFYTGWSANVAQKIPSYGLTWVFFQQFKRLHRKATDRPPTNTENFVLGAAAAGATVCIMIPMDTVKTRLVTQVVEPGVVPYQGVLRTLSRIIKEEGFRPIYRSLTPRLVSVVPMIGIQFGIYEFIRTEFMNRKMGEHKPRAWVPPAVRRKFGIGEFGLQQPEYVKDFLKNVYLLEEELV